MKRVTCNVGPVRSDLYVSSFMFQVTKNRVDNKFIYV